MSKAPKKKAKKAGKKARNLAQLIELLSNSVPKETLIAAMEAAAAAAIQHLKAVPDQAGETAAATTAKPRKKTKKKGKAKQEKEDAVSPEASGDLHE